MKKMKNRTAIYINFPLLAKKINWVFGCFEITSHFVRAEPVKARRSMTDLFE